LYFSINVSAYFTVFFFFYHFVISFNGIKCPFHRAINSILQAHSELRYFLPFVRSNTKFHSGWGPAMLPRLVCMFRSSISLVLLGNKFTFIMLYLFSLFPVSRINKQNYQCIC
jgi:hypothetical protein